MNLCFIVASFLSLLDTVTATNTTVIHGWQSEANQRGTWSIFWSCLATIFICTWSCVHLDVPKREQGEWSRRAFRLLWMALAVVVPEYFVAESFLKYTKARTIRNGIRKRFGTLPRETSKDGTSHLGPGKWDIMHAHFALARGFYIDDDVILIWTNPDKAAQHVMGLLPEPPVSAKDLESRGSADWIKKALAVFQILWFTAQLLLRYITHLHITAVEILTLAFIFCSLIIYGLCWNQAQNVEYPIQLTLRSDAAHSTATTRLDTIMEEESEKDPVTPSRSWDLPPVSPISTKRRSKTTGDLSTSSLDGDWFVAERKESKQSEIQGLPSKELAKSGLSGDTLREKEKHDIPVQGTNSAKLENDLLETALAAQPHIQHLAGASAEKPILVADDLDFKKKYTRCNTLTIYIGAFTGAGFGAVHCLLWDSPFPTSVEKLAWRIAAVGTACMPPLGVFGGGHWFGFLEDRLINRRSLGYGLSALMIWEITLLLCYVCARCCLIVLALMNLRALPADSYQTADWNNLIPHLGV